MEVATDDGRSLWRRVRADASYCSANDPRLVVGLGPSASAVAVRAHWPDGTVEEWAEVEPNAYTTLRQGTGSEAR